MDTNVLVSAFATRGLSADLLELILINHELVTGHGVLRELEKALRLKIKLPAARCREVDEFMRTEASLVVKDAAPAVCQADADDRLILGEALQGDAEVFVTGDAALVAIESLDDMRIVTPRQLWEMLRK
jgi:uncharacterized protein